MHNNKKLNSLSLTLILILLLSACGNKGSDANLETIKFSEIMEKATGSNSLNKDKDSNDIISADTKSELTIWAFSDSIFLQTAVSIFSEKYPNCKITLEFGADTVTPSSLSKNEKMRGLDNSALGLHVERGDIIQKLNVKLIGGDAPDVLFLDGLSIETLYNKGFLSDINLELDESLYYEKILKSYTKGEITYAYPSSFIIPVLISDGTIADIEQKNDFAILAELYKDSTIMEGYQDYWPIFSTYYFASTPDIFPDSKTINEKALVDFFTYTKKMIDTRGENQPFRWAQTSSTVSLLSSLYENSYLFIAHDQLEILPLFEGTVINTNIASIPTDASNKEIAKEFINTLLDDNVQGKNEDSFSIKKDVQYEYLKTIMVNNFDPNETTMVFDFNENYLDSFFTFDWDKLINSFSNSLERDYIMEGIIFDQATKLYLDEISIETAVASCMNKINIILFERN